jgi:hypothetical protein
MGHVLALWLLVHIRFSNKNRKVEARPDARAFRRIPLSAKHVKDKEDKALTTDFLLLLKQNYEIRLLASKLNFG